MAEHNQRFESFEQWCNKASSWLTRHPEFNEKSFRAHCFDSQGRHCCIGKDFMRARDEKTFPVHWIWPDQIGGIVLRAMQPHDQSGVNTKEQSDVQKD